MKDYETRVTNALKLYRPKESAKFVDIQDFNFGAIKGYPLCVELNEKVKLLITKSPDNAWIVASTLENLCFSLVNNTLSDTRRDTIHKLMSLLPYVSVTILDVPRTSHSLLHLITRISIAPDFSSDNVSFTVVPCCAERTSKLVIEWETNLALGFLIEETLVKPKPSVDFKSWLNSIQ